LSLNCHDTQPGTPTERPERSKIFLI